MKRSELRASNSPRKRRGNRPPRPPADAALPSGVPVAAPTKPERERGAGWIYGRHAVAAALANPDRRWRRLVVVTGEAEAAAALIAAAQAERLPLKGAAVEEAIGIVDRGALDRLLPEGAVHQGWALAVEPLPAPDLDDLLRAAAVAGGRSIVVVLDQVSDPHNVGAVLRSAAAFGAVGVIVAEHGAPPVSSALAKAASGALDLVKLVRVVNLARALDRLKEAGFWCCGLDEGAAAPLASLDLGPRVALVLGSEGGGLRRLVREHCDYLARLPTRPELPSLNVSNAAAIALYELRRNEAPS